jgi:RNA-directed DNA polymerase
MSGNASMAGMANPERLPEEGASDTLRSDRPCNHVLDWAGICFSSEEARLNRLQARIAKASAEKKMSKAMRLSHLLTKSFCARAIAVGKAAESPWAIKCKEHLDSGLKMYAVEALAGRMAEYSLFQARHSDSPMTFLELAFFELHALALSPIAESASDKHSFSGCRDGAHDACEFILKSLERMDSPWTLSGRIMRSYDASTNSQWLLDNIPMDKSALRLFLNARFATGRALFPGDMPSLERSLSHMALDGLEDAVMDEALRNSKKIAFARYEDEFMLAVSSKDEADEAKVAIQSFLKTRGLVLPDESSLMASIDAGFDMLGWTFKKVGGRISVKPSKRAIKALVSELSNLILGSGLHWTQEGLIARLNGILRPWADRNRLTDAKDAFSHIGYVLHELLIKWAKRRHRGKGMGWIVSRYWHAEDGRGKVFSTGSLKLAQMDKAMCQARD